MKGTTKNNPLVTFALLSYNQERFIREAVRGGLAQTYSPLQIIISDDCSQDRSFEIIQEEVASYEGPHRILLNRNERNLGIVGHVNRVMELAEGELIVIAAGDDVSLPARAEELVKAWSNGGIFSVFSNATEVDELGVEERIVFDKVAEVPAGSWQELLQYGNGLVLGCAHAWDRNVFDTFGPLPDRATREDHIIEFRSALLGKIAYVNERLVKYRRHGANESGKHGAELSLPQFIEYHASEARKSSLAYEGWLRDLRLFLAAHPDRRAELLRVEKIIMAKLNFYEFKESAARKSGTDRIYSCLRVCKGVKSLGVKPVIKACLLGLSPITYYRAQRRYYRAQERRKKPPLRFLLKGTSC